MKKTLFNSRDPFYRKPTGAVANGTPVHFKVCLPRYLCCTAATLIIHNEHENRVDRGNLFWCGMEGGDFEYWEVDYTPEEASLNYYYFELSTSSGTKYLGRTRYGYGELQSQPVAWQLTVYESTFKTPDWLSGGIMYQIFPDRFCKSGVEHPDIPYGRKLHENWGDQPDWAPNEFGMITNSDYFGGDLKGITQKLDYIQSLGVSCIYINPIFEAHENHRYNTADYRKIDPMLGTEEDYVELCEEARKRGIRIIIDGVFSHTGDDSVYFNKHNRYETLGAYNSKESPYYSWFKFYQWPDNYHSWWGISTLPEVKEEEPDVIEYHTGEGGTVGTWLAKGASGWRLDVADELPDVFLDRLRYAAKKVDPEAVIIGEVWEDASNKVAYGQHRRYLLGKQLDSVMNYPFKDVILGFLTGWSGDEAIEVVNNILENYPPQVTRILMNSLGTHDTERAITILAGEPAHSRGRDWQAYAKMSPEQREKGIRKMKLASVLQYTLPGVPCIYYGDEAGVEGYKDPFNRSTYPWGDEDRGLIDWYRRLGKLRNDVDCLIEGEFEVAKCLDAVMSFVRRGKKDSLFVAVNRSDCNTHHIDLPEGFNGARTVLGKASVYKGVVTIPPMSCIVLRANNFSMFK